MSETHTEQPEPHPNGVRTFANSLRDNVPMPAEMLERLNALEQGRHPPLDQIRHALGLDCALGPATRAATQLWPARGTIPNDEDFVRIVDGMHAAIASSRKIDVELTEVGPKPSRAHDAISLRDEDRLVLLLFANNTTESGMRFSAEAHGEGLGGYIEPLRAGSGLFDAGAMHPGSYLLPVMIVAEGRAATIDVPIECRASGTLRVRIVDDATGEAVPSRVYLSDDVGPAWPMGANIRRDAHGNAWFHTEGSFEARISGTARLRVMRGIEYEAVVETIAVAADKEASATVRLRRWSHMAADGWYSGDVHVHLHYGGEYLLEPADASLAQRAEDVNFMNMMVANQGSGWVHDEPYFEGRANELSSEAYILRWGEEYRNDFYGHMCMYGIDELVPPIYSGVRLSDHPHDLPANADAARHCHSVGGTLSYAHPLFMIAQAPPPGGAPADTASELDALFDPRRRRSVEAKELPVDAALGLIDAVDVMSYPGTNLMVTRLWYRLLNCGLRLAATAGTDTFMNHADLGEFSNPPAGDRVFVRVDGAFTTESWCAGVRAGRTFVSNAPMLSLVATAGGVRHGIGDDIKVAAGDVLGVEAEAGSAAPMERLELVVDGEIVATAEPGGDGKSAALSHDLRVERSCWIALRATGPGSELVLEDDADLDGTPGAVFAHTSAIYVHVDGAPLHYPADAAYFVDWIERLIGLAAERGRYGGEAEREQIAAIFRQGQAYYRRIAEV